jgi:hypothetical protein
MYDKIMVNIKIHLLIMIRNLITKIVGTIFNTSKFCFEHFVFLNFFEAKISF